MDRQQILLAKALEASNVPLSVDSFESRLILQKAAYVLQVAGVRLGYRFRWYLRGPYSPEMTAAVYGIVNEGEAARKELEGWSLDAASAERIKKLKLLLTEKLTDAGRAPHLERLASVLFLIKTEQVKAEDAEETAKILRRYRKNYTAKDVREAVNQLRAHGLVQ